LLEEGKRYIAAIAIDDIDENADKGPITRREAEISKKANDLLQKVAAAEAKIKVGNTTQANRDMT
jgi:hypothetical protein